MAFQPLESSARCHHPTDSRVTGLANGTAYTFEVRAANAAGQGPAATTAPVTPTAPVVAEKVVRLAGADRYATAAEIARQFPAGLPVLYVASGQNFPDALAGAALAATRDAPVVLVRSGDIPSPTAQALGELAPERIVILGGTASVSAGVETQLRAYATANTPDEVTRLQGADRYATAAAIARQFPSGVPVLYVASGQNFPDALAGAALAGLGGAPAVLVRTDDIPAATGTAAHRAASAADRRARRRGVGERGREPALGIRAIATRPLSGCRW